MRGAREISVYERLQCVVRLFGRVVGRAAVDVDVIDVEVTGAVGGEERQVVHVAGPGAQRLVFQRHLAIDPVVVGAGVPIDHDVDLRPLAGLVIGGLHRASRSAHVVCEDFVRSHGDGGFGVLGISGGAAVPSGLVVGVQAVLVGAFAAHHLGGDGELAAPVGFALLAVPDGRLAGVALHVQHLVAGVGRVGGDLDGVAVGSGDAPVVVAGEVALVVGLEVLRHHGVLLAFGAQGHVGGHGGAGHHGEVARLLCAVVVLVAGFDGVVRTGRHVGDGVVAVRVGGGGRHLLAVLVEHGDGCAFDAGARCILHGAGNGAVALQVGLLHVEQADGGLTVHRRGTGVVETVGLRHDLAAVVVGAVVPAADVAQRGVLGELERAEVGDAVVRVGAGAEVLRGFEVLELRIDVQRVGSRGRDSRAPEHVGVEAVLRAGAAERRGGDLIGRVHEDVVAVLPGVGRSAAAVRVGEGDVRGASVVLRILRVEQDVVVEADESALFTDGVTDPDLRIVLEHVVAEDRGIVGESADQHAVAVVMHVVVLEDGVGGVAVRVERVGIAAAGLAHRLEHLVVLHHGVVDEVQFDAAHARLLHPVALHMRSARGGHVDAVAVVLAGLVDGVVGDFDVGVRMEVRIRVFRGLGVAGGLRPLLGAADAVPLLDGERAEAHVGDGVVVHGHVRESRRSGAARGFSEDAAGALG